MDAPCNAYRHLTIWAYKQYGCRCPDAINKMRAHWRTRDRRRAIPGQRHISRTRLEEIDEVAVQRAISGDRITLTVPERTAAAAALTRRGLSARDIGAWLGVTTRTVQRYRRAAASTVEAA